MDADYRRAIARIGKHVTATVVTSKGRSQLNSCLKTRL